jgi:alpha-1,2-glucosyltransferase
MLRQTNVVWVLFALGTSLLTRLESLGLANGPLSITSLTGPIHSLTRLPLPQAFTAVIQTALPYISVALLSAAYLVHNNGQIVLGDKDAHQASLHWAQPLYCVTMMTFFAWPALLSSLKRKGSPWPFRNILSSYTLLPLLIFSLVAVHLGTIQHPYLLADNRHFTFYIWKKFINRYSWTRYAFAPLYAIMLRVWWFALGEIDGRVAGRIILSILTQPSVC